MTSPRENRTWDIALRWFVPVSILVGSTAFGVLANHENRLTAIESNRFTRTDGLEMERLRVGLEELLIEYLAFRRESGGVVPEDPILDLAMTFMFGGFSERLYEHYNEVFPLEPGWQERVKLWNLYPTLVHVVLFGGGYVHDLRQNLAKFV